jgi:uncharacterized membrane-anchored protein
VFVIWKLSGMTSIHCGAPAVIAARRYLPPVSNVVLFWAAFVLTSARRDRG